RRNRPAAARKRYAAPPRWSVIGVKSRASKASMSASQAGAHGRPFTAPSRLRARIARAAKPPKAARSSATFPPARSHRAPPQPPKAPPQLCDLPAAPLEPEGGDHGRDILVEAFANFVGRK